MINPHHNININISYNLTNQPIKSTHKKISKMQKISCAHSATQCDVDLKVKHKNTDECKKQNDHKAPSNDNKKTHKKKPSSLARNTFTPDLYERRIKTEGLSADQQTLTLKRDKSKFHSKSTQPALQKQPVSSKKTGSTKANKSVKLGHVHSFMLLNGKKNVAEQPEKHIKKQRAQSAFAKNDKVVSKLLNMSVLACQLGGSRPITSERREIESHSKTFKEYLSSIDVRILKTMSDDVPIFSNKISSYQQIVKQMMVRQQISLQELTRRVVLIQRAWRASMKKLVVNKYKLLFQQATNKLTKAQKGPLSSLVAQSAYTEIDQFVFVPPKSQSSLNIDSLELKERREEVDEYHLKWIEESEEAESHSTRIRQVVFGESEKSDRHHHAYQWGSMNKRLNNFMNDNRQFDPSSLLQEFIQQSNLHKQWIQDQYEPTPQQSHRASKQNACQVQSSRSLIREERGHQDELDESQEGYNSYKYINVDEQHFILEKRIQQLAHHRKELHEPQMQGASSKTNKQEGVVKGYLDCGLDDFGLNFKPHIISIDDKEQQFQSSPQQQQEYHFSSDEAIGAKFQEANRGVIRPTYQSTDEKSDCDERKEKEVGRVVQQAIQDLIAEFAIDISAILKKSTQVNQKKKSQATHNQQVRPAPGIPTNFNSIKDYLTKFICFIEKQQKNILKIIDNINKDIGPTSQEILSYLRPDSQDIPFTHDNDSQQFEEEGLFVIPAEMFERFQVELQSQYKAEHNKEMGPRLKAYANFWHRCIFESFNECLDYERPFGIQGKPYNWVTDTKVYRRVDKGNLKKKLEKGEGRLLEMTLMVGGIIFEKPDSPFANADFSLQEKHRINEERLSRILATELLQSEQSWINYNDQMAQLLVELSRMIEDKVFFEYVTQMKKLQRRRKMVSEGQQDDLRSL